MYNIWLEMVIVYGYLAVFLLLSLGILGLPIPDELLIMFIGYLAGQGEMTYYFVFTVSFLGSLMGMTVSFLIGKRLGLGFLDKIGFYKFCSLTKFKRIHHWFSCYGPAMVTFGYFLPGVRHIIAFFAGMQRWKFYKFLGYGIPGGLVWTILLVQVGYLLGDRWQEFYSLYRGYLFLGLACLILAMLLYTIIVYLRDRAAK